MWPFLVVLILAIVFVYDYHPDSKTLAQLHFSHESPFGRQHRSSHHHNNNSSPIPEKVLWGYIIQTAIGIKAIHTLGLACRVIDLSTLIITSDRRLRINCCGIMDVIAPMGDQRIPEEQLRDLNNFGMYMLCLAGNTQEALRDPARWIETVKRKYPGKLGSALTYLINFEQNHGHNIGDFLASISDIMVNYADAALQYISFFFLNFLLTFQL
jgi:PAB-dependent poly(A)-specific ribonuclease subunit 3